MDRNRPKSNPPAPKLMESQIVGKHRIDVSKVILNWKIHDNPCPKASTRFLPDDSALLLLKDAYDRGIDTWDITDCCANEKSETLIGRALTDYQIPRTRVVIMAKLGLPTFEPQALRQSGRAVRYGGTVHPMGLIHRYILDAVGASLVRLKTQYIDVLKVHYMEGAVPKELMAALNDLVQTGKVNYLCASNMYCWQLATLQYAAKMNGWTTFALTRGPYNLLYREGEREIYPFCKAEGIGIVSWDPLADGLLVGQGYLPAHGFPRYRLSGIQNGRILARVSQIAQLKRCSMRTLAIAWLLAKKVCPSVDMHDINNSAWEALMVRLTDYNMNVLEEEYRALPMDALNLNENV